MNNTIFLKWVGGLPYKRDHSALPTSPPLPLTTLNRGSMKHGKPTNGGVLRILRMNTNDPNEDEWMKEA